jgi:restriction system protein
MLLRVLGIGLLAIVAIPLVIAYPPLALLGLGGVLLVTRRPGRKRTGRSTARSRASRKSRPRPAGASSGRGARPLLWIVGAVGLVAAGAALVQVAPAALAASVGLGLVVLVWRQTRGRRTASAARTSTGGRLGREGRVPTRSGTEFERSVAALLEAMNYRNVRHVGGPGDRGIDIIASDTRGRTLLVQCKRFTNGAKVGSVDVQKLIGAVVHQGADGGIFVTTSRFTAAAVDLARSGRVPIDLYDGNDIAQLSRRLRW